jgi:hypothetical protein
MSKAQAGGIEIDEFRLDWDEMADIAGDLFDVQGAPGGLRWAKSAWQVLSEAGLTRYLLEVGRTVCILRFIALFALYCEFCVRAFDEGNAGDWERIAPAGLIGDHPLVDAFSLGQLTQQRDMFVNNGPSQIWDAQSEVITLLAKEEYRQVLTALQERWGERGLFAALSGSRGTPATPYPFGDDLPNQVFNGDRDPGMRRAWEWYDAGAGLEA